jgi:hypothetical protein
MTSEERNTGRLSALDWALVLGLWLLVAAVMLYGFGDHVTEMRLGDPDDALRLVQVRDLLAGQGWHDFSQYRIDPANGGGQIHWSRFIDVQIAGLILLLSTVLSTGEAERWAVALYPLLLIFPLLLLFQRVLSRLGDRMFVAAGLCVAASSFGFLHYFIPLRIDHHNWQLLLSLAMLWLALGPASWARGFAAAFIISMHVEISLEGLPYLVIFGALFAYDWLRNPVSASRLKGFATGLALFPWLWILVLRGPDAVFGLYCDAFSRPYLVGATATGLILTLLMGYARLSATIGGRIGALLVSGIVGGAAFVMAGPECLAGPFGNLSPLVREFWYEGIGEGHPVWERPWHTAVNIMLPILFGLLGLIWTWRREVASAPISANTDNWYRLVLAALASTMLSILVLRASAVTQAFVVPGYIFAVLGLFRWGRSFSSALLRIPATALAIVALPLSVSAAAFAVTSQFVSDEESEMPADCITPAAIARLGSLPTSTIFTTLDVAPAILVGSDHSVIATGHHRNNQAMHRVLAAFLATPAGAEKIVRKSGADYVVICPTLAEFHNFTRYVPNGFAADLARKRPISWLEANPQFSSGSMLVYRVKPTE